MRWSALVLLLTASPAAAQQDSVLRLAVRLATEGQGDSARSLVRARLFRTTPADSLYPEILYTAGVVAADADSALRYFRRTSVEFSQSAWADRALLRIAQLSFAGGDLNAAFRSAERVLTDYPLSPVRAQASFWAGRAQLDLGDLPAACRLLQYAVDSAVTDVELANRAAFYVQRCRSLPLARPDSALTPDTVAPAAPAAPPAAAPPARVPTFAVQIAAVRSVAAADRAMQVAARAGYQPRVVRDADGFLKVRIGQLRTRPEAQRLATDVRRKLGGEAFVVEEP
jgi:tetratricopeptide (TPR) repeat protein